MKEITIHIKEEDAFEQIIDYFYTSKLDINQSNVQKLIIVAGMLQLRKVQQACCDFVKRKITSENCLGEKFQVWITLSFNKKQGIGFGAFNVTSKCLLETSRVLDRF